MHPRLNALSLYPNKQFTTYLFNFCIILFCSLFIISDAFAQSVKTYNLPEGELGEVVSLFGSEAGILLTFDPALTTGKNSNGLQGQYSVEGGLRELLQGTGINWRFTSDNAVVLEATSSNSSSSNRGLAELAPAVVGAANETGYVATDSFIGRTNTPLIETPRSISVITAEQMENLDLETISEALRYTAGVMTEARGLDKTRPFIGIRGFYHRDATVIFRDGMLGSPFGSLLHPNIDLYGLERLELIRGPASVLYGQGAPGGMVVTVTKRPTDTFFAELEASVGSFKQTGMKFDLGGPLDEAGKHLYRLTGLRSGGDSQIDFLEDNKTFFAPAYTWRPNDNTMLTILAHYQEIDSYETPSLLGDVVGIFPNVNGKVPNTRFIGEPGHQFNNSEESSIGYIFEKEFSNGIRLRQSLRYEQGDLVAEGTGINSGLFFDNRTVERDAFTNIVSMDSTNVDTNLQYSFDTGAIEQTLLLGFDYRKANHNIAGTCCFAVSDLDLYSPIYGGYSPGPIGYDVDDEVTQSGFYIQDQINLNDSWIFNLGLRHDKANSENISNLNSVTTKRSDTATTFQAGVVYLMDNGLAPYASYSESFQPQGGTDFLGNSFDPTTGAQYELGLKYQSVSETLITASVFELTRQNVPTADLVNIGFNIQKGEIQSKGLEIEAKSNAIDNIDLIASYSYTDAEVTKSNNSDLGMQLEQIPKHQASVWLDYHFRSNLDGLIVGGGARYVGESPGDSGNTFNVPDRTLLDLSIRYEFKGELSGLYFKMNITNLLNEYYVSSCRRRCYLGSARTIKASIKYRW